MPLLTRPTGALRWNYFRDYGTRFGSPKTVTERSWPTLPLIPAVVPDGYARAAVANAVYEDPRPRHEATNSQHWSSEVVGARGGCPAWATSSAWR